MAEQCSARHGLGVVDQDGATALGPRTSGVGDPPRQGRAALEGADDAGGFPGEIAVGRRDDADRGVALTRGDALGYRVRHGLRGLPRALVDPDDALDRAHDVHRCDEAVQHEVRAGLQEHGVLRAPGLALGAVDHDGPTGPVGRDRAPLRRGGEVPAAATREVDGVHRREEVVAEVTEVRDPGAVRGTVRREVVTARTGEGLGAVPREDRGVLDESGVTTCGGRVPLVREVQVVGHRALRPRSGCSLCGTTVVAVGAEARRPVSSEARTDASASTSSRGRSLV